MRSVVDWANAAPAIRQTADAVIAAFETSLIKSSLDALYSAQIFFLSSRLEAALKATNRNRARQACFRKTA
jgi:hypothetical protein